MDYTEETKSDTSTEQVEQLTDLKQKKTPTPTPTLTVNPFHEISLIDIAHRHKMLIEKKGQWTSSCILLCKIIK